MADRQLECPVPRIPERNITIAKASVEFGRVALRWRALAERRCRHFLELQYSGRWKFYYNYPDFIRELRAATALAQRWAEIAPVVATEPETPKDEGKPQAESRSVRAA